MTFESLNTRFISKIIPSLDSLVRIRIVNGVFICPNRIVLWTIHLGKGWKKKKRNKE